MAGRASKNSRKKYRVLVLMHQDLVPPDDLKGFSDKEILSWKTEYDVVNTLKEMGHEVRALGVHDDLGIIRETIEDFKPHVAFNLLEEFHGISLYDQHVISYLELLRQPYTGCNPRGLMLAHDKSLSKKILTYHRIRTPRFTVFPRGKAVQIPRGERQLRYPLIVKSLVEHGSYGISEKSIVTNEEKLRERVQYLHDQMETHAMAEEYIEGRELYLAILGNDRLQTLPVLELVFGDMREGAPLIATSKVKWDWEYQKKHKIEVKKAKLPEDVAQKIHKLGRRIYRALELSGYARLDLRLTEDGRVYVLEANPNGDIGFGEELCMAYEALGAKYKYEDLLQRVITLGMNYKAEWRLAES